MSALSRNPNGRKARRAEIEVRLLEATTELLSRGESFAQLRIEDIAEQAGISRTGFYAYFDDKRELLLRLLSDKAAPLLERVDELGSGVQSGPEAVAESLRVGFALARTHSPILLAAAESAAYDEIIGMRLRELEDGLVDAVVARLERQQERGAALPGSPRALAAVLVSMVTSSWVRQLRGGTSFTDEELLDTLWLVWRRATYGPEDNPAVQPDRSDGRAAAPSGRRQPASI